MWNVCTSSWSSWSTFVSMECCSRKDDRSLGWMMNVSACNIVSIVSMFYSCSHRSFISVMHIKRILTRWLTQMVWTTPSSWSNAATVSKSDGYFGGRTEMEGELISNLTGCSIYCFHQMLIAEQNKQTQSVQLRVLYLIHGCFGYSRRQRLSRGTIGMHVCNSITELLQLVNKC